MENRWEKMAAVTNFIFLGSKITADGDCSHEIKTRLLLGKKDMTNWDSILKSRDITLATKFCIVKAMVFPVVMYGCESWTIKKAEHQRVYVFELWCWRRLLRVRWTARRSNQSILQEIIPEYSLEGLMLKLKLQYFGHLIRRADSLKDPDAGKDWRQEEKGKTEDEMVGWHHWFDGHEFEQAPGVGDGQGGLACWSPWGSQRVGYNWLRDWTDWKPEQWILTLSSYQESAEELLSGFIQGHLRMQWKVKSLSPIWLFATLWTVARQAPLSMGFSRQEYWSGLPLDAVASRNHHIWTSEGSFQATVSLEKSG